ncbi:MAG TPA: glycosyltransferase family 4 protein [Gemmatimonadaceae bacterium]|nr:glycosyltransferase family 4 protein [Gemmatimonadaceae bacterium]
MTVAEVSPSRSRATGAPTRVLFIIYGLQPAGPELRLLEFAREFPPSTEVHICVIGDDLTLLDEFRRTNAKIFIVPVRRPWSEWSQLRKVTDYIGTHGIAIVNSFDLKTLLVALAAKMRYGRRIRLVHHLISLWDGLRDHHKQLVWQSLRFADVVICNGYAVKEGLIGSRRLKARVTVVPNGVDCEHFRPMPEVRERERARLGYTAEHIVIGTVANVRPVKNYPLLLNTMRRLADTYAHVRLLCVGGGEQLAEMQAFTRQLGLAEHVRFAGQASDIRPWVAAFDVFALTSFKEGCPNALMQAMAMAVPSMSSAVGEVPHLTDQGKAGLLFDPTDPEACFAAATRLVEDRNLRAQLGAAGRRRMQESYSSAAMIRNYVTLFRDETAILQSR